MIQKYQTALGIQEPERSYYYTTGNSPPLVSALLAARPQRGVRPFSYVCTDINQFLSLSLQDLVSCQPPHLGQKLYYYVVCSIFTDKLLLLLQRQGGQFWHPG